MEIWSVNDFRISIVDPDFPKDGLARGAISVAARVMVVLNDAAFLANACIDPEPSRLAVHDCKGGFVLNGGGIVYASVVLIEFLESDFHPISHWRHLRNQTGF
jgi:hypothetical protein